MDSEAELEFDMSPAVVAARPFYVKIKERTVTEDLEVSSGSVLEA